MQATPLRGILINTACELPLVGRQEAGGSIRENWEAEQKITHLLNDHCSRVLEVKGSLGKYRKLAVESGELTLDGHGGALDWAA